ncbi:hypothetical protein [Cohnella nanjingensis]|uniref:Cation transporter n=1 Tax=Cohnella nanjingensis TaxID=1387779 RepID=A0A7X0VDA7_9BACL|nr:hypothetical protein [Cohnella nanjingensis]MBB6669787.1 hypothetical protein [Cohnella nanjingensis]
MADKHQSGLIAIWISLISNIALTALKVIAGLLLASPVLLAASSRSCSSIPFAGAIGRSSGIHLVDSHPLRF